MSQLNISDGIVRLAHALVEDASLRSWFLSLEHQSTMVRRAAFTQIAEQMRARREDPDLAAAVSCLTRPEVFDAVRKAVRDRCGL